MGSKTNTAFTGDVTLQIWHAIMEMAKNTNRLYAPHVTIAELRDVLLPPDKRELASTVHAEFERYMSNVAYTAVVPVTGEKFSFSQPDMEGFSSASIQMSFAWTVSDNRPSFCISNKDPRKFFSDSRPDVVKRLLSAYDEWVTNAVRMGFVLRMFDQVNEAVMPLDRMHARMLLPGIVPLLRRAGQSGIADRLAKPRILDRSRLRLDIQRDDLVYANELIAAAVLMPQNIPAPEVQPDRGWMRLVFESSDDVVMFRGHPVTPLIELP